MARRNQKMIWVVEFEYGTTDGDTISGRREFDTRKEAHGFLVGRVTDMVTGEIEISIIELARYED